MLYLKEHVMSMFFLGVFIVGGSAEYCNVPCFIVNTVILGCDNFAILATWHQGSLPLDAT